MNFVDNTAQIVTVSKITEPLRIGARTGRRATCEDEVPF